MTKQSIIAYAVLVLLGIVLVQHFLYQNEKYAAAIEAADARVAAFDKADVEMKAQIRLLEDMQVDLQKEVNDKEKDITGLKQDIIEIKRQHAEAIAKTFRLDTDDETIKSFKEVFPAFASGTSAVMQEVMQQVGDTAIPVPIYYAKMPTAYLEHFIRLKTDKDSLTGQVGKHEEIEALNVQIKNLKDENFDLEVEKREEYKKGYDLASAEFKATNEQYVALLKEKRFSGTVRTIGSFVVGLALGANF